MAERGGVMRMIKAGALYFACVFGAGFVFGSIRVPLLVPRLGVRVAELIEMPLMLCVIVFAARWIVRRFELPATPAARLGTGLLALAMTLAAEFAFAAWLEGQSVVGYIASRDPVSGTVYAAMLLVYAAMPLWVGREPMA